MHEMQMIFFSKFFFWKFFFEIFIFLKILKFFLKRLQNKYTNNKYTSLNNEAFQLYSFHTRVQGESLVLEFFVWVLIIIGE